VRERSLTGVHHLAISVTDLDESAGWYERVLGFQSGPAMSGPGWQALVITHPSGLLLKLMRHETSSERFDERRTGLDHIAFRVPSAAAVDEWVHHLDAAGVQHSGSKNGAVAGSRLVVFRDPDGVQLECYFSEG
jgi:glyoxylase I family protein